MAADLLARYSNHLKEIGVKTRHTYLSHVRAFFSWLTAKNVTLDQLSAQLVNEYLCHRKALGRTDQTIKGDHHQVRNFLRFARSQGLISHDPAKDVSCHWLAIPGGFPAYQGILREGLSYHPSFLFDYRLPLFAPDWEDFLKQLMDHRYSKPSIREMARSIMDFHRYLTCIKVRRLTQITPRHLAAFIELRQARYLKRHGHPPAKNTLINIRGAITLFLDYAFGRRNQTFRRTRPIPDNPALPNDILRRYLEFCRVHKGLKPITIQARLHWLKKLGRFFKRRKIKRIETASIADYDGFILDCTRFLNHKSLFAVLGALRCFLRYLYLEETIPSDLAKDLISPCRFSADLRPKYLPWSQIEQLLAGIDRGAITGKRDYAILTLLSYHGLRAREAAKLAIPDVDWDTCSLTLRDQKNRTTSRIPLSQQAKEALQDYLAVRPNCPYPEIFLTKKAPLKPLGAMLYHVAGVRLRQRFGSLPLARGSGLLRHSFAKLLLDRRARLSDIMLLLRHKSMRSTQVYTRIATEDMREVADNYANLLAVPSDGPANNTGAAALR
ncbi:MAG: site-specific integrase [Elusimicrobia bacterium]|nr:site-specific integrase [Elusimicrobiota bacterium]